MTNRTDPTIPEKAVASDGRYYLMPMMYWNKHNELHDEVMCVHRCGNDMTAFFVANPVNETCEFCGTKASDKIQTLFVLHNGHY